MKNKTFSMKVLAVSAAALAVGIFMPARAGGFADVVLVVDESGSMAGEHSWIAGMLPSLEAGLLAKGVGTGTPNQYAIVGFGSNTISPGDPRTVTSPAWTTAADAAADAAGLIVPGGFEDGYDGIAYAFDTLGFRAGAAVNVILVTDEDRDIANAGESFASIKSRLAGVNGLLNAVVNNAFLVGTAPAIGVSNESSLIGYLADGLGGYTASAPGAGSIGSGFGTTTTDYVDLALQSGGAGWDLNILRNGGLDAASFTAAFVDIKVKEVVEQTVPEGETYLAMVPLAAFGVWAYRRRQQQKAA